MNTLTLSWPNSALSPNSRKDRRHTTDIRAAARDEGFYQAKADGLDLSEKALLAFTFCPPDKRRRDIDNAFGAMKYHRDGIAKACGVDDSGWQFLLRWGDPVPGGCVHIAVLDIGAMAFDIPLRGVVNA